MSGDTFGKQFVITTYGESHGDNLGVIIEGCPKDFSIDLEHIQKELDRRKPGQSDITTPRKEPDELIIISGIKDGKTTGDPIELQVKNTNIRSKDYSEILKKPRPGHADMTYYLKYGEIKPGGGRSSGRETVSRVMAGAIAKQILTIKGVKIRGKILEVGGHTTDLKKVILDAKADNDSVGGIIEIIATGVPAGLGLPVFDKLEADFAKGLMSIPAIKGVEFGEGFNAAKLKGSENNDPIIVEDNTLKTTTNHAGGILGGISNGMPIIIRIAIKPASSIGKEQDTVDLTTMQPTKLVVGGRHDPCICPRVVPVAESMVALVLVDHLLRRELRE